jgi:WD40 repeat protein
LVLVGTKASVRAPYVNLELGFALEKRKIVLPIDISGIRLEAPWPNMAELPWLEEERQEEDAGTPSPVVLAGITNQLKFTRSNTRARRFMGMAAMFVLALGSVAVWQWRRAVAQAAIAHEQTRVAVAQKAEADRQRSAADQQKRNAEEQTRLAVQARQLADEQRRLADERRELALARQLAAQSELVSSESTGSRPDSAYLALEGLKRAALFETRRSALHALSQFGRPRAVFSGGEAVNAVKFSPNGHWAVAGGDDGTVLIVERRSGGPLLRFHTEAPVRAVDVSKDSHLVAVGTDKGLHIFDLATQSDRFGQELRTAIRAVAFSPEAPMLVVGCQDGSTRAYDTTTGKALWRIQTSGSIGPLVFSRDGKMVATGDASGAAVVSDAATGNLVSIHAHDGAVRSLDFSPDGKHFVTGTLWQDLQVIETAGGGRVWQSHRHGSVEAVVFSPTGQYVAAGLQLGDVELFEALTGKGVSGLLHDFTVTSLGFSPDGRYLASGAKDRTARILDVESGREVSQMMHGDEVESVSFSPDGAALATGGRSGVRIFAPLIGWEVARFPGKAEEVFHLTVNPVPRYVAAFSPKKTYVAIGTTDQHVHVYRLADEEKVLEVKVAGRIARVTFSADEKLLGIGTVGAAHVMDLEGRERQRIELTGGAFSGMAFSPDGRRLAAGSFDHTTRIYEWATRKELFRITHDSPVIDVAFSPDGKRVASAAFNQGVRIVDAVSGPMLAQASLSVPPGALAFSPDGEYLVVAAYGNEVTIFNAATGNVVAVIPNKHTGMLPRDEEAIGAVAFSAGAAYVATGSKDGIVSIYDVKRKNEVLRMQEGGAIAAVAFSGDGKHLYYLVAGEGLSVHKLPWETNALIRDGCSRLQGREMAAENWKSYASDEQYIPLCPARR